MAETEVDDKKQAAKDRAAQAKAEAKANEERKKQEVKDTVEAEIRKLRNELAELGVNEAAEKEKLRQEIEDLKEWKAEQLKLIEEQGKFKKGGDTLVVPPNDVTPPANQPDNTPTDSGSGGDAPKPKGGWKRWW